jgi:hypothetical protein
MKMNLTAKRISAAFLALALCASFAAVAVQKASANNGRGDDRGEHKNKIGLFAGIGAKLNGMAQAGLQPQVQIGPNGRVLVRGAKVTAISGSDIDAQVTWGSYVADWNVDASDAKILQRSGGNSALSQIAVGNTISFSGMLDTSESSATVSADVVKNWSVNQDDDDAPFKATLQGELKAMGSSTAPTTLTVEVKDTDYTVNISAATAILNRNWIAMSLANFALGDTIRFYGDIDGMTAEASVVRNVSR